MSGCGRRAQAFFVLPLFAIVRSTPQAVENLSCVQEGLARQHPHLRNHELWPVPVIISDRWQRPPGIPWKDFSVVVSEGDVLSIPALLDRLEGKANEMGRWQSNRLANISRQMFFWIDC